MSDLWKDLVGRMSDFRASYVELKFFSLTLSEKWTVNQSEFFDTKLFSFEVGILAL